MIMDIGDKLEVSTALGNKNIRAKKALKNKNGIFKDAHRNKYEFCYNILRALMYVVIQFFFQEH